MAENNTLEQECVSSEEPRRCFLAQCGSLVLAATAISPAVVACGTTVLNPVMKEHGGKAGKTYRVASLNQLTENGPPQMVAIKDNQTDGWMLKLDVPVGAVWIRRKSGEQVQAFQALCPHAGCPIMYDDQKKLFYCPCHAALFDLDGKRTAQPSPSPSPRDMDTLEVTVENGDILVAFKRFKEGTADKTCEG